MTGGRGRDIRFVRAWPADGSKAVKRSFTEEKGRKNGGGKGETDYAEGLQVRWKQEIQTE